MSQWTHVMATMRFCYMPKEKIVLGEPEFWDVYDKGYTQLVEQVREYRGERGGGKDCINIPTGSETSLMYNVWHSYEHTNISVWGDLRDYDDEEEILTYFTKICNGQYPDGILEIHVEGTPMKIFKYISGKWELVVTLNNEPPYKPITP
jgi:hypothetical protein